PQAVLIRAIEPHEGQLLMEERRPGRRPREWTNGPGKLTKALGVTMNDYGRWITEQPLYIESGYTPEEISTGPRIGIDNSGEARDYPWRFWVTGNRYVSR
ncbi:DNA-3-methyladenine glycosylase, partial [Bacillus inaquosorum]